MAVRTRESLDTNIILRIMLKDIPEQCLRIQDLFLRQGCVYDVADLAITEAVYVMQKNFTRHEVVKMIKLLFELPDIRANFGLFERVLPMYLENPKLSFNDCCLAGYAALNEAEPLWTFDKDLAKTSGTAKLLG